MCSLYLGENLISGNKPINLGVRNIGEIVSSAIPLTDAGLHLLDGSLILGGGIYQGFVDYIAELYGDGTNIPSYFCTESEWQTAVTTYGVCGKFVYDSTNNTVRLPKVTGIIEGTTDVTALGDLVEAGLPVHTHTRGTMNITGYVGGGLGTYGGAFYHGWDYSGSAADGGGSTDATGNFDASRSWTGNTSNPIYTNDIQNSSTVQPQTIKAFYYIVIANSAKTDIQVDIDEIATDLNGKADVDLSNTTPAISFATAMNTAGIRTVVETYVNGTSWYRVYSDGWCEQGGFNANYGGTITLLKKMSNNTYTCLCCHNGSSAKGEGVIHAYNKTTTSFNVGLSISTSGMYGYSWYVSGYIN